MRQHRVFDPFAASRSAIGRDRVDVRRTVTAPDQRLAWAVGHWATARAAHFGVTAVAVGERAWDRADRDGAWTEGDPSPTVTITLQ